MMKQLYVGLRCILLSLAMLGISYQAYADLDLGNIWTLGDSITYGASDLGGYRDPLYASLTGKGYTFSLWAHAVITHRPTEQRRTAISRWMERIRHCGLLLCRQHWRDPQLQRPL